MRSNTTHNSNSPLAVRMRPQTLEDFVGQADIVGPDSWLQAAIAANDLKSIILFGPPGTGKTTLAKILASTLKWHFVEVSAISGTVKDLRDVIAAAKDNLQYQLGDETDFSHTILFVDEIHRFSKSQQDILLGAVEDGVITLIGATTENPFFEVNAALLSRCHVLEFKRLDDEDIKLLVERAMASPAGLNGAYRLTKSATIAIVKLAGGDARGALNILDEAATLALTTLELSTSEHKEVKGYTEHIIAAATIAKARPKRAQVYDKNADAHYDTISAFIKSIRGSDPDAAVYYLARMLAGGEDPKFIARRLYISAAEDVGLADPNALTMAHNAFKAAEVIGMPEVRIILSEVTIYLQWGLTPKLFQDPKMRLKLQNSPMGSDPNALSGPKTRQKRQNFPMGSDPRALSGPKTRQNVWASKSCKLLMSVSSALHIDPRRLNLKYSTLRCRRNRNASNIRYYRTLCSFHSNY